MKKYNDVTAIASNFGEISHEERERIVEEAERFSLALFDAYIHGNSTLDNLKIRCEETDKILTFSIKEKYARIKLHDPTFNDISREEFQKLYDITRNK